MTDDLLAQMSRALADEYDGATAAPEATRARVIRTLAERRPRKRKWLIVGIPAFVLFGGSTAWAAATGQLDRIVEKAISVMAWEEPESPEPVAMQPKTKATPRRAALPIQPQVEPPTPEEEDDEQDEAPPVIQRSERPVRVAPATPQNTVIEQSKQTSKAQTEDHGEPSEDHTALLTFQAAHRAQFSEGNCARAIALYAEYLLIAPQGSFAIEAQYNRGVCLVRLGRHAAGRMALQPFAQGVYGDYRRSQSTQLLDAIDKQHGTE